MPLFIICFDHSLGARAEISQMFPLVKIFILKLSDVRTTSEYFRVPNETGGSLILLGMFFPPPGKFQMASLILPGIIVPKFSRYETIEAHTPHIFVTLF